MKPNRAKFAIVIKTDSYAGNFEREMCAYLTGHVGECEVGKEYFEQTLAQEFENIIGNEADDNGCYRPVTLGCDIEGFTNQDVVIFFNEKPTQKHLFLIKERLPDFDYSGEKVLGLELIEFHNSITRKEI
jgi:hypothetical protein